MTVQFRDPNRDGSARLLLTAMAALHFLIAGMLLYLRWGPIERAFETFIQQGLEIPAWLSQGMTLGTVFMALFLTGRGLLSLRKAWRGGQSGEKPPEAP